VPKELAKATTEFKDIKNRVGPMLDTMGRLDNNFWNATTGIWNRYYSGLDMLRDRLQHLNAPNAAAPVAANDPEVQQIVAGIATAKLDSRKISQEYWTTATRVQAIAREVQTLKTRVDAIAQQKSGPLSSSKSVPALQTLSQHLATFKNDLDTACLGGPHRPNHALLQ
jgi:uncharacterized phage infection (PIP) family protein YhgE